MKSTIVLLGGVFHLLGITVAFQLKSGFHKSFPSHRSSASSLVSLDSSYVNIDEHCSRDVQSMEQWAASCGVQRADGVQLYSEDGLDWAVGTNAPLPQGSPILAIPRDMILSSSQSRQQFGRIDAAEDVLEKLSETKSYPEFYLVVSILLEYQKGDQSPWFPWLNSLPRYFSNGAAMTPFCFECLPPLVASLASKERFKFIYFHQAIKKVEFLSDEVKNSESLVRWAFNVVQTRSIGKTEKLVVPMADMFNHAAETEVQINFDDQGNCMAYASKDIQAGSPLRVSYGDPTNPSLLFATYGFLDESSKATFCKYMIEEPSEHLKDIGYDPSRMLFYTDTGAVSQEVWDVILYKLLGSNEEVQEAFYDAHMNDDFNTKGAIHQQFLPKTSILLKTHIDNFLKRLDMLSANAEKMDVNQHPRIPVILRHNDYVRQTFLKVKQQVDQIAAEAATQAVY